VCGLVDAPRRGVGNGFGLGRSRRPGPCRGWDQEADGPAVRGSARGGEAAGAPGCGAADLVGGARLPLWPAGADGWTSRSVCTWRWTRPRTGHRCTELRSRTRAAGRRGSRAQAAVLVGQLLAAAAGAQGRHPAGRTSSSGARRPAPVLTWSPFVRAMTAPGLRRTRSSTQGRSRSAPGSCSWRIAGATQGSCPRPQRPQTRLQMRGQRQIESTATAFEEAGRAEQLV
jgi:hypothetical protein